MTDFSNAAAYMENVLLKEKHVPGCDLLVLQDHRPIYRHICGYSDTETREVLTENHLYHMYSCTKPLTVTAGMRLYEEGKLSLDAPVSDYLPAFADVFLEENGVRRKPVHPLTVRNLFTMTGGFDYALHNPVTDELLRQTGGRADTRQIVDTFAKRPLCFEPGDHFQYSLCHDILAAVIEEAAGMRFSDYLFEIMFEPLGMQDSTFHPTEAQKARIAGQYRSTADGTVLPTDRENSFHITEAYESGGAGLLSSAADYAKFADTLSCGGKTADGYQLLKPETIALLHTEQLSSFTVDSAFSCAAGPGYGYGLGVRTRINQNDGQRSPIGEFGWDGAAGAYVMMDPVHHFSIFFAMHVLNWPACIGPGHAVLRDMLYDDLHL